MAGRRDELRAGLSHARRFGRSVGAMFMLIGAVAWWRDHALLAAGLAAPGALLVLSALVAPAALVPVERAWMRGAVAISRVTTPIIMGIAYLVVITPIGFAVRHLKGDPLRHAGPGDSYWIPRDREADRRGDLTRQF
jgi:hypothetical protein